jgi:response regulator RpfG family c-di-GMP phosphodiesterase
LHSQALSANLCSPKLQYKKNSEKIIHNQNLNTKLLSPRLDSSFTSPSNIPTNCSNILLNDSKNKAQSLKSSNSPHPDCINIIVTDDEIFTRLSTVRTLKNIGNLLNINLNILEAEDGVETTYLVYKAANMGIKISFIFSDECMNFMNGLRSSNIIKELIEKKGLAHIPFYLVTAYEGNLLDENCTKDVTKIFSKPLNKKSATDILEKLKK